MCGKRHQACPQLCRLFWQWRWYATVSLFVWGIVLLVLVYINYS